MICSLDRPTGRMTPRPLSGVTRTVLSKVKSSSLHLELKSSLEILEKSKFSVSDVFDSVGLDYWYAGSEGWELDSISFDLTNSSMILPTRSIYPADKMTFTLADLHRDKTISNLNIFLELNKLFDVALVLEDSKRKELSECPKNVSAKIVNFLVES